MLVITDSGLGGLTVCAGIERAWREAGVQEPLRVTYLNAWPEEGRGYNDFPDVESRAAVFDRALDAIDRWGPDRILIACNTLSILHAATARSRHTRRAPVLGIIDAGVDLFERTLRAVPASSIVLVGTRTTVESGVHRDALVARGIAPERVTSASCHGLATAIERDLHGAATAGLIETCAERAAVGLPREGRVFLGLCCTHYGMAARPLVEALGRRVRGPVTPLDPNAALVERVMREVLPQAPGPLPPASSGSARAGEMAAIDVRVISKVTLPPSTRDNVAAIIEATSPATARALRDYTHAPDLF